MSSPVSVTRSPGQTIYAFPDRSEGFSLDDWCFEQQQQQQREGIYDLWNSTKT